MKLTSMRRLLGLVLAIVLVAGQWAGQMHALSHAKHALALAINGHADQVAGGKHSPPNQDHSRDRCVAFQAIDSAAVMPAAPVLVTLSPCFTFVLQHIALLPAEPAPYSSRAPPLLS